MNSGNFSIKRDIFINSLEYLKGVGPKRAALLRNELGLNNFNDLLHYFPFRYIDKSRFYKIIEITNDLSYVQLKGKITRVETVGQPRSKRLVATLTDNTGKIDLVWFKGIRWYKDKFNPNIEYIVYGKPSLFNNRFNIPHPDIEPVSEQDDILGDTLHGYYSTTEKLKSKGLASKQISKLVKTLLHKLSGHIPENLSVNIIQSLGFISREEALINIHFPRDQKILQKAQARLKFDELFFIQLRLLKYKVNRNKKITGHKFPVVGKYLNNFYNNNLSFELTNAQKKVIKEIRADLGSGRQMNRLLQGDVGSGKTLVAVMAILIALDNGCQACFMAPTEILANQHYDTISRLFQGLDINLNLLTGSIKPAERKDIHESLINGQLHVLVGTHALIEEKVRFKNLGMVIIDEQHRFGVAQRARLWYKNIIPPHILVMTATPIPRTLAMTLYGDLDFSIIDEMPPGRKSVKTYHFYDSKRLNMFGFLKKQIREGRQVYIVYPIIKESEKLDLKNLMDGYESILREFPLPEFAVSIVHGQMKSADKDYEMQRFINGETQIMVATTVIEVGVDIPNASVMVIENAERFGLSQLHQLRGRVGRGGDQSYCLLMSGYKLTAEAKKRLETMVQSSDGFEIAETDLRLRGPGDLQGTQQSGILDLKLANLIKDEKILKYARNLAMEILEDDPELEKPSNIPLLRHLEQINKNQPNWASIG
jgi:ATP-dependent DNA helicase RecG